MQYDLKPTPWAMIKRAQFNVVHEEYKKGKRKGPWRNKHEHSIFEEWELVNKFIEGKKYNQLYVAVKYGLDAFFDLWTKLDDIETNTALFKEILESTLEDDKIDFNLESSVYMKIISMKYSDFIYTNVDDLRDSNFRTFFDYDKSMYIPPLYKNFVLKDFFKSCEDANEYEAPELNMECLNVLDDRTIYREFDRNYIITKIVKENLNGEFKFLDEMIDNSKCICENYILN
ncbi:MAG: hypothetical protein NTW25_03735 [Candidatus Kapabacteria bacterium]|nr:hypothetical protein [Candidatus Kapabacteria bacterium]